ncbi:MAG: M56 family metallopeptidase [Saprospiraceae bacterium]
MSIKLIFYSTIIWAILLIFYLLFLRKEKFFIYNRIYLILSIIIGFLISINSSMELYSINNSFNTNLFYRVKLPDVVISNIDNVAESNLTLVKLIWNIYFLGVVIMLFKFIKALVLIYSFYKSGCNINYGRYKLILHNKKNVAFSFFNYIFISDKNEFKKSEIISHELVHIKYWHSFDILFFELIKIIFWFNPIIYLYEAMVKENHEFTADNEVIKEYSRKNYSEILINQLQSGMQLDIANNFINSLH